MFLYEMYYLCSLIYQKIIFDTDEDLNFCPSGNFCTLITSPQPLVSYLTLYYLVCQFLIIFFKSYLFSV